MNARANLIDVINEFVRTCPNPLASRYVDEVFPSWCEARKLTLAEARVLRLAVGGMASRRAIAEHLGVKPSTVKLQIRAVCQKTNAATLRDAVVLVLRAALERAGR